MSSLWPDDLNILTGGSVAHSEGQGCLEQVFPPIGREGKHAEWVPFSQQGVVLYCYPGLYRCCNPDREKVQCVENNVSDKPGQWVGNAITPLRERPSQWDRFVVNHFSTKIDVAADNLHLEMVKGRGYLAQLDHLRLI